MERSSSNSNPTAGISSCESTSEHPTRGNAYKHPKTPPFVIPVRKAPANSVASSAVEPKALECKPFEKRIFAGLPRRSPAKIHVEPEDADDFGDQASESLRLFNASYQIGSRHRRHYAS